MIFDLQQYLTDGLGRLIKDALKVTFKNRKQSAFFLRFAQSANNASARRNELGKTGLHVPPFLIASITGDCNLNCTGCYSQANGSPAKAKELTASEWGRIFKEAANLGVSVILLAGGEPLLRSDVILAAAKQKDILFPVFTNGTMLDRSAIRMFEDFRNMIPIISIEGDEAVTDSRRGQGVHKKALVAMSTLNERGLMFGVSVTVTSANLDATTDKGFISELERYGCKVALFVEYVPFEQPDIALHGETRSRLAARIDELRTCTKGTIIISFPGDEAESGGCLAAGRGFFHISATGDAEPCPFSPYSDLNLRDKSLREAIMSPFFTRLREDGILSAAHTGGCVLFEQEETVARMASQGSGL